MVLELNSSTIFCFWEFFLKNIFLMEENTHVVNEYNLCMPNLEL